AKARSPIVGLRDRDATKYAKASGCIRGEGGVVEGETVGASEHRVPVKIAEPNPCRERISDQYSFICEGAARVGGARPAVEAKTQARAGARWEQGADKAARIVKTDHGVIAAPGHAFLALGVPGQARDKVFGLEGVAYSLGIESIKQGWGLSTQGDERKTTQAHRD